MHFKNPTSVNLESAILALSNLSYAYSDAAQKIIDYLNDPAYARMPLNEEITYWLVSESTAYEPSYNVQPLLDLLWNIPAGAATDYEDTCAYIIDALS